MSRVFLKLSVCAGLSVLITTAACGGGSSSTATQMRVLQGAPNAPSESVLIDSSVVASNLGYSANTGYLAVKAGSRHLQLEPTNSTTPIFDQTISIADSTETTVIVQGLSPISGLVLTDDNTAPAAETAMLRVVNSAPSMGAADVYLVPAGSSLTGVTPIVPALAFGAASSYQSVTISTTTGATNTFEVLFTQPGTTLTFLSTGAISLSSGQNRTVVALDSLSGGFSAVILADLN